jgi:coiled-coil domain-containing protein 115
MSSTLPSPPPSPRSSSKERPSGTTDNVALTTHLDALLELYLAHLDAYTSFQTTLSTQLSTGFLSLAAANRNAASVLGPGRRFGQDGFDGRMKALRGVRVEKITRPSVSDVEVAKEKDVDGKANTVGSQSARQPNALRNVVDGVEKTNAEKHEEDEVGLDYVSFTIEKRKPHQQDAPAKEDGDKQKKEARDPLKWYTALPPQSLRRTQAQFVSSLETVGSLAGEKLALELLEAAITDVRQQLSTPETPRDLSIK